jgi:predicted phosphodiesterase
MLTLGRSGAAAVRHRLRLRSALVAAGVGAWLSFAAFLGVLVAVTGFSQARYAVGPAEMSVRTSFASRGSVDVYVPILDWGIRAHPYTSPLRLSTQVVSVDREAALGALRSRRAATSVRSVEGEAPGVVREALLRALVLALAGGLAGGSVGGLVLMAATRNRRGILGGAAAGVCLSAAIAGSCALGMRNPDYGVFRTPTFYAHGGELPKLLTFSDRLVSASQSYESSYEQALDGLSTLVSAAAGDRRPAPARSFMVASDIHANTLVFPAFELYADHRPVFLVGDFAQQGTAFEAALTARAGSLGHPTVAVSGNHDTPLVMRSLVRNGAVVLTARGRLRADGSVRGPAVQEIDGLLVAGFGDPRAEGAGSYGHGVDLTPQQLDRAAGELIAWYDDLSPRPQIVMVHDFRLAANLAAHAAPSGAPLLILTGHDHRQHVDQAGRVVVVDGGTLGAGGVFQVGRARAGFAQVHISSDGWPLAVDLIEADPLSGDATARRLALVPEPPPNPPPVRHLAAVRGR